MEREAREQGSLIAGLFGIAKNLFDLLLNRVELMALELAEVRANLLKLLLVAVLGLIAAGFALLYGTVLVVYLAWDALGWKILLLIAAVFALLAAGLFRYAYLTIAQGKLSMPATMNELHRDREALFHHE